MKRQQSIINLSLDLTLKNTINFKLQSVLKLKLSFFKKNLFFFTNNNEVKLFCPSEIHFKINNGN